MTTQSLPHLLILPVHHVALSLRRPDPGKPDLLPGVGDQRLEREIAAQARIAKDMQSGRVVICMSMEGKQDLRNVVRDLGEAELSWATEYAMEAGGAGIEATAMPADLIEMLMEQEDSTVLLCDRIQQERRIGRAKRQRGLSDVDKQSLEAVAIRRPMVRGATKIYLKMLATSPDMENVGLVLYAGPVTWQQIDQAHRGQLGGMRSVGTGAGTSIVESPQGLQFRDLQGRLYPIDPKGQSKAPAYGQAPPAAVAEGQNCASCRHYLNDPLDPMRGYCKLFQFMVGNRAWCASWEQA